MTSPNLSATRASMKRNVIGAILVLCLSACGDSSVAGSREAGTPPSVPGTSAFVGDKVVSPLHVGQYIGQLEIVEDPEAGRACEGKSGSESTGDVDVTLHIDGDCKVYVDSID